MGVYGAINGQSYHRQTTRPRAKLHKPWINDGNCAIEDWHAARQKWRPSFTLFWLALLLQFLTPPPPPSRPLSSSTLHTNTPSLWMTLLIYLGLKQFPINARPLKKSNLSCVVHNFMGKSRVVAIVVPIDPNGLLLSNQMIWWNERNVLLQVLIYDCKNHDNLW